MWAASRGAEEILFNAQSNVYVFVAPYSDEKGSDAVNVLQSILAVPSV
jgi:hypothetical protein